ncbi:hypothetical protein E1B28_005000 [Marasmius oreades]|uniref:RING-type domain-containing protein n=1 Tax=Marasmius oreades TaxID=181124 RepID=A0A9P7UZQ1_9AGAR|nr:uncharacterized protein E1B28_005000 [Marasmius oreades]KAG7097674.1 hypothetical protein E1B28_005000 [Marasmius oreades]
MNRPPALEFSATSRFDEKRTPNIKNSGIDTVYMHYSTGRESGGIQLVKWRFSTVTDDDRSEWQTRCILTPRAFREVHICNNFPAMFKCPQCPDRSFLNPQSLIDHQRFSTKWHPFCKSCDMSLGNCSRRNFEDHLRRHRDTDAEFRCSTCSRGYATSRALDEHYRQSPNHPNCPVRSCRRGFRNKVTCEEHVKQSHPTAECSCGDQYFIEEGDQHLETSSHHPVCAICNIGFVDAGALSKHENIAHKELLCKRCERHFINHDELVQHYLSSFAHPTCEICCLGFADDDVFRQHIMVKHSSSKPTILVDVPPNNGNIQANIVAPGHTQDSGACPSEARTWKLNSRASSVDISSPIVRSLWDSSSTAKNSAYPWEDVPITKDNTEDRNMVSMVERLIGGADTKHDHELPVTIYESARSPIAFTGLTKSLSLHLPTLNFNDSSSCTAFNPFGPPVCSTPSPDTSSPQGLAVLPVVSPLASTPSDVTMLDGHTNRMANSTSSTLSTATFPSKDGWKTVNSSPIPRRDSTSSIETRVESVDSGDRGGPAFTKVVTNDRWKLFDDAISALTSPADTQKRHPESTSIDTSIETQGDTTLYSQSGSESGSSDSSPLSATATSPDLSSISLSTVEMLILEQELEEPLPRQALKIAKRNGSSQPPIERPRESLVYCRLCGRDPCDDCTATLCGHLYCRGCITEYVIKTPRCPTCSAPTLLYCLFRLDLS